MRKQRVSRGLALRQVERGGELMAFGPANWKRSIGIGGLHDWIVIASAAKQSSLFAWPSGLLRCARNDEKIKATEAAPKNITPGAMPLVNHA